MEPKKLILEDIVFPLEIKDVYADFGNNSFTKIPGKKALINKTEKEPISIIGNDYEIITNQEAFDYGVTILRNLFKINNDSQIVIKNIYASKSKSFCHIDLSVNKNEFKINKDEYIPFIRITNSYNKMYSLSFRVGVLRLVCSNGMMVEEDIISYKYDHVRGAKKNLKFNINSDEFDGILNRFKSDIELLQKNTLPEDYPFPIFCKALGLTFDLNNESEKIRSREEIKLNNYKSGFNIIQERYSKQLGNNFYSLFNVITDFASNGLENDGSSITHVNSRQTRAGTWLNEISNLLRIGNIDYNEYLKDYLDLMKN